MTVTVACCSLVVMAVLAVLVAAIDIAMWGDLREAYHRAYVDTPLEPRAGSAAVSASVGAGALSLLFGAFYVLLAVYNGTGSYRARFLTLGVAALTLCCCGFGVASSNRDPAAPFDTGGGDGTMPEPAETARILHEHLPDWHSAVTTIASVLTMLLAVGVVVLLALPASNAFFQANAQPDDRAPEDR